MRGKRGTARAFVFAAMLLGLSLSNLASAATAQLTLPPPTGHHRVGEHSRFLVDRTRIQPETGRPRAIPIRIWYPAAKPKHRSSPAYMVPAVEAAWEQLLELPAGSLAAAVPAIRGAPFLRKDGGRPRVRGVILLIPGYLSDGSFQTNQAVELASHGYVVITTDHPGTGYAVQQPGGAVVQATASETGELLGFSERIRDVRLILTRIPKILPPSVAAAPKAILGHSMGGAVAAGSMFQFRELRAGMDYDGSPLGDVVAFGLSRPFGLFLTTDHQSLIQSGGDPFTSTFLQAMRAPHPVHVLDVAHWGFTDWAVLSPQLVAINPQFEAQLASIVPSGTENSLSAGEATVAQVRTVITRFLNRHLVPRVRSR